MRKTLGDVTTDINEDMGRVRDKHINAMSAEIELIGAPLDTTSLGTYNFHRLHVNGIYSPYVISPGDYDLEVYSENIDQASGQFSNNWGSDDDVYIKHNPFYVGFTSNSFHGRIEEVVVYNKAIYPILPQQQEYVFKKPLQEIQGSAPVSYAARLFIKDYHNIRGTVPTQVASSSQISYTKAGFDLTG